MIKIITTTSSFSARKAISWLTEYNLEFEEINITNNRQAFERKHLIKILSLCDNGFNDILSFRRELPVQVAEVLKKFEDLSFNQALAYVLEHPYMLYTPIIFDENKIQVGYHAENIRKFIPEAQRKIRCQVGKETLVS